MVMKSLIGESREKLTGWLLLAAMESSPFQDENLIRHVKLPSSSLMHVIHNYLSKEKKGIFYFLSSFSSFSSTFSSFSSSFSSLLLSIEASQVGYCPLFCSLFCCTNIARCLARILLRILFFLAKSSYCYKFVHRNLNMALVICQSHY